jgi:hypothetical protein
MYFLIIEPPKNFTAATEKNIAHLKIFRSITYEKISHLKSTKLDDKSKKYIIIGYNKKFKAYNHYDPVKKKLMISKDVDLNEEAH